MELRNERRNERKKKCFKSKQSQNVHINSGKKHRKKNDQINVSEPKLNSNQLKQSKNVTFKHKCDGSALSSE